MGETKPIASIEEQDLPSMVIAAGLKFDDGSAFTLPPYIQPARPSLSSIDMEFLRLKSALDIPPPHLRNELLRCFVEFVHPFMPILDINDFIQAIAEDSETHPISLLLFQSVLFAGMAYVDLTLLRKYGYRDRQEARRAFYYRAKLLHDLDYETTPETIIQSALLLTYQYENSDDSKGVWYWLDLAMSHARASGINYYHSSEQYYGLRQHAIRKRLWWCCFIRHVLVAFATGERPRIGGGDYNVPRIITADFDMGEYSDGLDIILGKSSIVFDLSARMELALLFVGLADLCTCISEVLETVGTPKGPVELLKCDSRLQQWYENHKPLLAPSNVKTVSFAASYVHRATLEAIYLTASAGLHRPQLLQFRSKTVGLRRMSLRKSREAAEGITTIFKILQTEGLVQYLSNTGVTCLLTAAVYYLLNASENTSTERLDHYQKFWTCMASLNQLRGMYETAAFSYSFLNKASYWYFNQPIRTESLERIIEQEHIASDSPLSQCDSEATDAYVSLPQLELEDPKAVCKTHYSSVDVRGLASGEGGADLLVIANAIGIDV